MQSCKFEFPLNFFSENHCKQKLKSLRYTLKSIYSSIPVKGIICLPTFSIVTKMPSLIRWSHGCRPPPNQKKKKKPKINIIALKIPYVKQQVDVVDGDEKSVKSIRVMLNA